MQDSIVETHSLPSPTHSGISAFWAGIRAVSPLLMGVLPFALIAGSSAASVSSNAVEVYIHGLRKKLGNAVIETVRGLGYTMPRDDTP